MPTKVKNIITIGASAGGIPAVSKLVSGFDPSFDAAVFVVIHIPREAITEIILRKLQQNTKLKCVIPTDGEEITRGIIYLAPANNQMMIEKDKILIRKGPYENHWRPAIDVLFRTAAAAYSSCVTGIILTGLLDDGTSGMVAIKKSGGTIIVQDPEEAEFADMPLNIIQNVEVDYTVAIHEMPYIINDLYARESCEITPVPKEVKLEADITLRMSSNIEELKQLGVPSDFTCPDCGGMLTKITADNISRYRCFTGHSFNERVLAEHQLTGIEESIWTAIRMMEERKNLLRTMEGANLHTKEERATNLEMHIERLKGVLLEMRKD